MIKFAKCQKFDGKICGEKKNLIDKIYKITKVE